MLKPTIKRLNDSLNIIWTIAAKDIVDALRNRLVLSLILLMSMIIFLPKMLVLIFEQPKITLPVYDLGDSQAVAALKNEPDIAVQELPSEQEFDSALCGALFPQIGLRIPADFDQVITAGGPIELQGTVCWGKRHQVADLKPKLEEILSQSLGVPVTLNPQDRIVYPPEQGLLFLSTATLNAVLAILLIGVFLVPSLLFEEKQTRTMQALLVSPASTGQVVTGKALAGAFYILVTGAVMFAISWEEVIHWDIVILFVVGGGFLSVAIGLLLGSFYEKQQDIIGWMSVLLLFLIGTILVKMLGLEMPALVESILPWTPSLALAEIYRAAFTETVVPAHVLTNLAVVVAFSLPLYAVVIWKIQRSDRF